MTNPETPAISAAWLEWLRDFRAVASQVIEQTTILPSDLADEELQSVRCALYARTLSLLETASLLAEHDRQLDLRGCCRSVVECAVHLGAADRKLDYVAALKADDSASRRSRGMAFRRSQPPVDAASLGLLDDFLDRVGKPQRLEPPSELAASSRFPRLAHAYREISADAAHVTFTSLIRHVADNGEGLTQCIVNPALLAEELQETLEMIGLSLLICTFVLARNLPNGDAIVEQFEALQSRYNLLRHVDKKD